jgi:hypothetical protein
MKEKKTGVNDKMLDAAPQAQHVGGVTDEQGGVDPLADENLMRLSGGP